MKSKLKKIISCILLAILVTATAVFMVNFTQVCADNYHKKTVYKTCRSMIETYYESVDVYETYEGANSLQMMEWAMNAKETANKTAEIYNKYISENAYVWSGNFPDDIEYDLPVIE